MYDIANSISAARACLGTPFVPQGRLPQVGLDCGGLIITALRGGGLNTVDAITYDIPPPAYLLPALLRHNDFQPHSIIETGTLLLFSFNNRAQHLALATSSNTMIHAFAPAGRVIETTIGAAWRNRLLGIYRHQPHTQE